MEDILKEVSELLQKKQQDYATRESPWKNFEGSRILDIDPAVGMLVRMLDKIIRIKGFIDREQVAGEPCKDSVKDLIGYAVLLHKYLSEHYRFYDMPGPHQRRTDFTHDATHGLHFADHPNNQGVPPTER